MPSPAELRAEAARLESEAAALRTRAKKLRRLAATLEVAERELAGGGLGDVRPRSSLQSRNGYDTVAGMESTTVATIAKTKHRGPDAKKDRPMTAVMRAAGLPTLAALAGALRESVPNVRLWNHRGSIPGRVQPKIDALLKPAQKK